MKKHCFLLILAIFLLTACGKGEALKKHSGGPIPVETIKATEDSVEQTVFIPGVVTNTEEVHHEFQLSGTLEKIFVKEGETVKKGQLLAKLEKEDYQDILYVNALGVDVAKAHYENAQTALKQKKSQYEEAKKNYNHVKILFEKGAASKDDFDKVKLAKETSKNG